MKTKAMIFATLLMQPLVIIASEQVDGSADTVVAARVLKAEVRTRDVEELRYMVLRPLLDRYADQQGIVVRQSEIADYLAAHDRAMARDRKEREAQRERLRQQLQAGGLSGAERDTLSSELALLNDLLEDSANRRGDGEADSAEEQAAREQIASAFIRQWKINRALYRQYGGRIIFQQGGPEPLDAYRLFLEERQRQGDFEILDPGLESAFWKYYRTDAIHSFYPSGSMEERQVFDRPSWKVDPSD